jgi:hypothetical protein
MQQSDILLFYLFFFFGLKILLNSGIMIHIIICLGIIPVYGKFHAEKNNNKKNPTKQNIGLHVDVSNLSHLISLVFVIHVSAEIVTIRLENLRYAAENHYKF